MESRNPEKDRELDKLAENCVIRAYTNKKRGTWFKLDEKRFEELIKFVDLYIKKSVFNSTKKDNPDLVNVLRYEVFKLLSAFGPTPMGRPFSVGFKLRMANILTNKFRQKLRHAKHAQFYLFEDFDLLPHARKKSSEEISRFVDNIESSNMVQKLLRRLPERERFFATCLLEADGDFNEISERTGYSQCYIRKVLRRISENGELISEVFGDD